MQYPQRYSLHTTDSKFIHLFTISLNEDPNKSHCLGCVICQVAFNPEVSILYFSFPLFFFFFLKKPGHLSCGICHVLDFADCIAMFLFIMFFFFLWSLHTVSLIQKLNLWGMGQYFIDAIAYPIKTCIIPGVSLICWWALMIFA